MSTDNAIPRKYARRPAITMAIQWTGENIMEVQKLFPSMSIGYLRGKGIQEGEYLQQTANGSFFHLSEDWFHFNWKVIPDELFPTKDQVLSCIPKSLPKGTPDLRHAQDRLKRVRQVLTSQLRKEEMDILFQAVIQAFQGE